MDAMIADFAICPFTKNSIKAGIPRGNIRYTISQATTIDEAYRDYWFESATMLSNTEIDISTILLIFPYVRFFNDFNDFQLFTNTLDEIFDKNSSISPLFEEFSYFIDNVYFHPNYKFIDKDEQTILIFDDNNEVIGTSDEISLPINYARRSPYPMINILRSQMVKKAQKNIPHGKIFESNQNRLNKIGSINLQNMLDLKNWEKLNLKNNKNSINDDDNNDDDDEALKNKKLYLSLEDKNDFENNLKNAINFNNIENIEYKNSSSLDEKSLLTDNNKNNKSNDYHDTIEEKVLNNYDDFDSENNLDEEDLLQNVEKWLNNNE
jgi:hypothetical protein